jgi:hypothetical protein
MTQAGERRVEVPKAPNEAGRLTRDKARRIAAQHRQAAGAAVEQNV